MTKLNLDRRDVLRVIGIVLAIVAVLGVIRLVIFAYQHLGDL